jgi:hypothetical protein
MSEIAVELQQFLKFQISLLDHRTRATPVRGSAKGQTFGGLKLGGLPFRLRMSHDPCDHLITLSN